MSHDPASPVQNPAERFEQLLSAPDADLKAAGEAMSWADLDEALACITAILESNRLNGETHCHIVRWKLRDAAARLEAQQQELKDARAAAVQFDRERAEAEAEVARLTQERQQLREALEKYGEHYASCRVEHWIDHGGVMHSERPACTCGLDAVLSPSTGATPHA